MTIPSVSILQKKNKSAFQEFYLVNLENVSKIHLYFPLVRRNSGVS